MHLKQCLSSSEIWNAISKGDGSPRVDNHLAECTTCRNQFDSMLKGIHDFIRSESWSTTAMIHPHHGTELQQVDWGKVPHQELIDLKAEPLSIGRYRLLELIDRGGEGVVYRAWDPQTMRMVAVKFKDRFPGTSVDLWRDEGVLLSQIQHENLVQIYDRGVTEHSSFIVMEWVDGATLRQAASCEKLSARTIFEIIRQLAAVVGFLHQQGIVHLDLKPDNVMIVRRGRMFQIKLIDFGLAWNYGRHRLPDDVVAGTPGYMAPEQTDGLSATWGPRTDVFCLGTVLQFLLEHKNQINDGLETEFLTQLVVRSPVEEQNLLLQLQGIANKARNSEPDHRFQNGQEFEHALLKVAGCQPGQSPQSAGLLTGILILLMMLTTGAAWMCEGNRASALDRTTADTQLRFHPASMILDLSVTHQNLLDCKVWLWSRASGTVACQGAKQLRNSNQHCSTSQCRGLEVSSSAGPVLAILAVEDATASTLDESLRPILDQLGHLSGDWPDQSQVRITPPGICPAGVTLSPEDLELLKRCWRNLKRDITQFDMVLVSIPRTRQVSAKKTVALNL